METPELNVVTGAFGYTGKYITRRLLSMGEQVKTITSHPGRPTPFGDQVSASPFNFDQPAELVKTLQGASTLYNTYWVRFDYEQTTFYEAVRNTLTLFSAAQEAGIRRVVHVSITNPDEDSPLPYFKGKAVLETALKESGLSYAIIRPTVIFGREDILINNIAWCLRRLPFFVIPGSGRYKLQPVYVEDMAEIAVEAGHQDTNSVIDAVGPEMYSYQDLVRLIAETVGSRARIVHVSPALALRLAKILGILVRDVVLTREEIDGLMAGLLVSDDPPTGKTRFSDWLKQNADVLGLQYSSEMSRHYR
ncbi:MAG: SDR family oxidoreductase [Anaerolineae bacterium]